MLYLTRRQKYGKQRLCRMILLRFITPIACILDLVDYNYAALYVFITEGHITPSGSQSLFTLVLLTYLHGYLCTTALIIFGALLRL